jgi:hypothetical protein
MSDVTHIQEQSRRSFFQWHVLLMLKKKQLEATLADAGYRPQIVRDIEADLPPVMDSDELALLKDLGLPIPEDLSDFDLPDQERIEGIRFFFHTDSAFDNEHDRVLGFVRQLSNGSYEHRELMRVSSGDRDYLDKAALKLNQALSTNAVAFVFNASLVWSAFHGAMILHWVAVSSKLLGFDSETTDTIGFQDITTLISPNKITSKKRRRLNLKGRNILDETS